MFFVLFYFRFLTTHSLGLYPRLKARKGNDHVFMFLVVSFERYFSVTVIVLSLGEEHTRKVPFHIGRDCQLSCQCIYLSLSLS